MPYIDSQGRYYEGDRQGQDQEVPQRPGLEYKPSFNEDGSFNSWVVDASKQAEAINAKYQPKLDNYLTLILKAMGADGAIQQSRIIDYSTKYKALLLQKNAELEALENVE
jgi:hypothetical protein